MNQIHPSYARMSTANYKSEHDPDLTDSLICISYLNEAESQGNSLQEKQINSIKLHMIEKKHVRLSLSAKIQGKSLATLTSYKTSTSYPNTAHTQRKQTQITDEFLKSIRNVMNSQTELLSERYKLKSRKMSEQQKFLRLSPVNLSKPQPAVKKSAKKERPNGQFAPAPKLSSSFRLPYSDILTTQDKAPRIEILEVSCGSCGHIGSVYKHRTEKGKCVKCGRQYKNFKVYKKFSSTEVRDMLARKS